MSLVLIFLAELRARELPLAHKQHFWDAVVYLYQFAVKCNTEVHPIPSRKRGAYCTGDVSQISRCAAILTELLNLCSDD